MILPNAISCNEKEKAWPLIYAVSTELILAAVIGSVVPFGGFLDSNGLPLGVALAWVITTFELVGSALLCTRRFVVIISMLFALELLMGIVLVHGPEGWFVVGAGRNGVEYSALLITGFLAVIASKLRRSKK